MDTKLEFLNGECKLTITPCDDWEKKLIGAIGKGGERLSATVVYKSEGHYSYGKCEVVKITLEPFKDSTQEDPQKMA